MVCYKYFGYIETNIIRNHLIKQTIMKELKTAFTEQIADEGGLSYPGRRSDGRGTALRKTTYQNSR